MLAFGISIKEIADTYSVSTSSIEDRITAGLQRLRLTKHAFLQKYGVPTLEPRTPASEIASQPAKPSAAFADTGSKSYRLTSMQYEALAEFTEGNKLQVAHRLNISLSAAEGRIGNGLCRLGMNEIQFLERFGGKKQVFIDYIKEHDCTPAGSEPTKAKARARTPGQQERPAHQRRQATTKEYFSSTAGVVTSHPALRPQKTPMEIYQSLPERHRFLVRLILTEHKIDNIWRKAFAHDEEMVFPDDLDLVYRRFGVQDMGGLRTLLPALPQEYAAPAPSQ